MTDFAGLARSIGHLSQDLSFQMLLAAVGYGPNRFRAEHSN